MQYRTVEGEISGTVNTPTNLTTFGAETGVGPIKVPSTAMKILEVWVALAYNADTANDSSGFTLRLLGPGMKDGQQDFIIAAGGSGVTSTGSMSQPAVVYKVDLDVKPNEFINVQLQYTGSTIPANTCGVTLAFA